LPKLWCFFFVLPLQWPFFFTNFHELFFTIRLCYLSYFFLSLLVPTAIFFYRSHHFQSTHTYVHLHLSHQPEHQFHCFNPITIPSRIQSSYHSSDIPYAYFQIYLIISHSHLICSRVSVSRVIITLLIFTHLNYAHMCVFVCANFGHVQVNNLCQKKRQEGHANYYIYFLSTLQLP